MSAVTTLAEPAVQTLADLLERLGHIPLERIRFHPAPGTATEQDVLEVHDRTNHLCELVDGVLVEKAMGFYESRLAAVLIGALDAFLKEHDLGIALAPDGMMRLSFGLVRMPDVSFLAWDKFPDRKLPADPIPDLAPDLAVEVLSESNTPAEMQRKLREYFAAGVRLVWYMDPEARNVTVYTSPHDATVIGEDGILDGGEVLPEFVLPVKEWMARAGERA